ncbi:MAG TPA: hypothetical protein VKW09_00270 [bacterium]|nr:hypothetical protein [bacterium]
MPPRPPSLCVLSCRWGDGHQRVGEAVAAAWRAATGGSVEVLDYFAKFVHPLYSELGMRAYVSAVRRRPALYGMLYEATDRIRQGSGLQRTINRVRMTRLERYLRVRRPDVVCCVDCAAAGTMSDLKAARRARIPCAAVVTDYDTHAQWIHPNVDRYCVPRNPYAGASSRAAFRRSGSPSPGCRWRASSGSPSSARRSCANSGCVPAVPRSS